MTTYLVHQRRDGYPVGVWTQNAHYYDPSLPSSFKAAGEEAIRGRNSQKMSWEDFCEQQASKSPTPTQMWDLTDHADAPLSDVLNDFQNTLE